MLSGLLTEHEDEIMELLQLSNESLLSGDIKGKIIIWDINRYRQIQSFSVNSNVVGIFELKPNEMFIISDKYIVNYQNNKKINLHNFDKNKINF